MIPATPEQESAGAVRSEAPPALRCPNCGWSDVRLSRPRGALDRAMRAFRLAPYRCRSCGERFYRFRRPR